MLTGLISSAPFQSQGGDRLVSKVVSAAIAALFKRSERVEANVRAEPVTKLLQGSVDSTEFIGHGMLMYNGLRIQALELFLQAVAIDFSAIFTGQIKLRQPTQATMRVVLTEEDLTASFNTPFIVEKLQWLHYEGNSLNFQTTSLTIQEDKSLWFKSSVALGKTGQVVDLDFTARLEIQDQHRIQFADVKHSGEGLAVELGQALVDHVNNLLDLDKFALDGTRLKVNRLRIQGKELIFYGTAHFDWFPKLRRQG